MQTLRTVCEEWWDIPLDIVQLLCEFIPPKEQFESTDGLEGNMFKRSGWRQVLNFAVNAQIYKGYLHNFDFLHTFSFF